MVEANECITFKGEDGTDKKISETVKDMHAYKQLDDSVSNCKKLLIFVRG